MWKLLPNSYSNASQWKNVSLKFNNKIKNTFLEKWFNYWKLLARDYKDVVVNLKTEIRNKPLKAATYFTGISFVSYCIINNPDLRSFRAKYIESANDMALINSSYANPSSVYHLKYVEKCFNANLIRYISLGVLSIIWIDEFSKECDVYECKCSYLQVPYRHFATRILDVGFLNTWWVISRRMLDYDVN